MTLLTKYSTLFKLDISHLYYLNKGLTEYATMIEIDKEKQLDSYDFNSFFKIIPSAETKRQLNGLNLVFITTNTGFVVLSKVSGNQNNIPFISLDGDISFTFLIQLVDSKFFNYTDLELESASKLYYFSNKSIKHTTSSHLFISRLNDNVNINKNYILSEENTIKELSLLSSAEKENLFGIVRIFMRGDTNRLHILNSSNQIIIPSRTFELQFKNRSTFWRYIFRQAQTVTDQDDVEKENSESKILITKSEHPLTKKGFISIDLKGTELPNPNANLVKPSASVDTFYSEIYM